MKRAIVSCEPVSIAEVKHILSGLKSSEELNFRASRTEEYASNVSKISLVDLKELFSDLEKLNVPRLKREALVKIADTLPSSDDDVKLVLSSFGIPVAKEHLTAISDVVKKCLPK
ncbi:hypothetical protein HY483_02700 [Candidatus Woesearchaeota archaeon]|nr:hypothetical protein [Candidatus Woesearchaeota archaeon]